MRIFLLLLTLCFLPLASRADWLAESERMLASLEAAEMQDSEIYQELRESVENYKTLVGRADDARAREASLANRALTGVTMGAMGVGLAQAGQGMAERRADDRWAAEIAALTDSFRCGISGQGHNIRHNETGTVPRESTRFREIRLEYLGNDVEEGLAQRVRRLKERLGMPPGIESEAILDTRGLYTADARMDQGFTGGFTTAQDRADAGDGARRAQTGAIVAGAGLAVGVVGNWAFNNKWPQLGSGQRNAASDPWVAGFQNDSRNANLIQQAGGMPAILQAANAGNRDMNRMNDAQRTEFITEFVQNQPNQ